MSFDNLRYVRMAESMHLQREDVSQVAGRILFAWRKGEASGLKRECDRVLESFRASAASSTLEMERLDALSGIVESLADGHGEKAGAVRLLEHLARGSAAPLQRRRFALRYAWFFN